MLIRVSCFILSFVSIQSDFGSTATALSFYEKKENKVKKVKEVKSKENWLSMFNHLTKEGLISNIFIIARPHRAF